MPGAKWFEGARLNYAEHAFLHAVPDRPAILARSEARGAVRGVLGRARAAGRRDRRVLARARRAAGRPRRLLHAEHPADGGAFLAGDEPRRGLVELLARHGHRRGRRPVQADRAEGAVRRRRLPLRRQALRPPRRCSARSFGALPIARASRVPAVSRPGGATRRGAQAVAVVERRRARGDARVRAAALRPSAVDRLFVRHHRRAEGDRARPRRHRDRRTSRRCGCSKTCARATGSSWCRAPAGSCGRCWSSGLLGGCTIVMLRRQPGVPRRRRALALHRRDAVGALRLRRGAIRALHEGGRRAGEGRATSSRLRVDQHDRLAADARRLRVGLRAT